MNGNSDWTLSASENVWVRSDLPHNQELPLVVLLRVRNEGLILADTLRHISSFADLIVAYDDASTDDTLKILKECSKVGLVIENREWLSSIEDRLVSETRHRGLLLSEARMRWRFCWCMCCDADERYVGNIRAFVCDADVGRLPDAVRIQLFDAYMTSDDREAYRVGSALTDFRQYFGPERRDILMLWKNSSSVCYRGLDSREPCVEGRVETMFYCQHYGKALSLDQWEATCDYYVNHFPFDPYGKKWLARKGKAIHSLSDFGRPLFLWGENLFEHAVVEF